MTPAATDRRTLIADTALSVIGRLGTRALTHRGIDEAAGLPAGSTSWTCRRRVDLLRIALERLYELDAADLAATAERCTGLPDERRREVVADLVVDWASGDGRVRSVARVELFMAASHEPALHGLLRDQLASMSAIGSRLTRESSDAGDATRTMIGFWTIEGFLLNLLRSGLPAPAREDVVELLRHVW